MSGWAGRRDYQDEDLGWVELALCMRSAGLPVEAMIQYVKLCQQGDGTFAQRLQLLQDQRAVLVAQAKQIQATMDRLDYKIGRYQQAVETGVLSWEERCVLQLGPVCPDDT